MAQIYTPRVINYIASIVNCYDTNSGVKITMLALLSTIVTPFIIQATGPVQLKWPSSVSVFRQIIFFSLQQFC